MESLLLPGLSASSSPPLQNPRNPLFPGLGGPSRRASLASAALPLLSLTPRSQLEPTDQATLPSGGTGRGISCKPTNAQTPRPGGRARDCDPSQSQAPGYRPASRGTLVSARFSKIAASKDGCGVGEVAAGSGRRLHLGIPEAVFVVSGQQVFDATLLYPFFLAPHRGLGCWGERRWAQLPGRGRSGLDGLNWGGTCLGGACRPGRSQALSGRGAGGLGGGGGPL